MSDYALAKAGCASSAAIFILFMIGVSLAAITGLGVSLAYFGNQAYCVLQEGATFHLGSAGIGYLILGAVCAIYLVVFRGRGQVSSKK